MYSKQLLSGMSHRGLLNAIIVSTVEIDECTQELNRINRRMEAILAKYR